MRCSRRLHTGVAILNLSTATLKQIQPFLSFFSLSFSLSAHPSVRHRQMWQVMLTCLPACIAKCLSICCYKPLSLTSCWGPTYWDELLPTLTSTAQLSLSPSVRSCLPHFCCLLFLSSLSEHFFLPARMRGFPLCTDGKPDANMFLCFKMICCQCCRGQCITIFYWFINESCIKIYGNSRTVIFLS